MLQAIPYATNPAEPKEGGQMARSALAFYLIIHHPSSSRAEKHDRLANRYPRLAGDTSEHGNARDSALRRPIPLHLQPPRRKVAILLG